MLQWPRRDGSQAKGQKHRVARFLGHAARARPAIYTRAPAALSVLLLHENRPQASAAATYKLSRFPRRRHIGCTLPSAPARRSSRFSCLMRSSRHQRTRGLDARSMHFCESACAGAVFMGFASSRGSLRGIIDGRSVCVRLHLYALACETTTACEYACVPPRVFRIFAQVRAPGCNVSMSLCTCMRVHSVRLVGEITKARGKVSEKSRAEARERKRRSSKGREREKKRERRKI